MPRVKLKKRRGASKLLPKGTEWTTVNCSLTPKDYQFVTGNADMPGFSFLLRWAIDQWRKARIIGTDLREAPLQPLYED